MSVMFRTRLTRQALASVAVVMLCGCGGGGGGTASAAGGVVVVPTPAPSATPAATPTPSPTPTSAPSPTPTPTATPGATLSGVLSEGDSISLFGSLNHTGIYSALHPGMPYYGKAVGGSDLLKMLARYDADVVAKPKVVTLLIGANDVYAIGNVAFPFATDQDYLNAIFAWAAKWRATGAKVAVGTVMALCMPGNPNGANDAQRMHRVGVNAGLRAAVGTKIDAVYDIAADPVLGTDSAPCDPTLFPDGTHPGLEGQARIATIYQPVVDRLLN